MGVEWADQTRGASGSQGSGIAYTGAGGAIVTGYFSGEASFGSASLTSRGRYDAFVMHVTASGVIDWAIQAGGTSDDRGFGIAHDGAGGALVTGYFSGEASFGSTSLTSRGVQDAFVMHVTASGAIDWAIQAGGTSYDGGYGIAQYGAGGALVTGYFYSEASFGSTSLTSRGVQDAFVMHVTASGDIDWAIQAGGTSDDGGFGIAHDGTGGALVTGYFYSEASFGSTSLTSRGDYDAFVMHVAASGVIGWAVQADGTSDDGGYGIAHDGAGGALVTGYFSGESSFGSTSLTSRGSYDAFVMHVTASGDIDWAIQTGGTSYDGGYGIAHDGTGGALVTGYFSGEASFGSTSLTSRGEYDAFVMHVAASGVIDWAAQAGGRSYDRGYGITHDGAGGALVTGYFSGEASFGSTSLTSFKGSATCFVASLIPPPPLPPLLPRPPPARDAKAPPPGSSSLTPPPPLPPLLPRPPPARDAKAPPPGSSSLTPPPPLPPLLPRPPPARDAKAPPPGSSWTPPSTTATPDMVAPRFDATAALTSAIALALALLLACGYRRYRRLADNFRASRDRAQLDLHILEHRFMQHTYPQCEDMPGVPRLSVSPPNSIPPGPPSSSGSSHRGSNGSGAGSVIDEGTLAAIFMAPSREVGLAKLRPYLDRAMPKQSADSFEVCCGKLYELSRVSSEMAPDASFAKAQEITDALSRECSTASRTAASLVLGLKRIFEERILPNGALAHVIEHDFRLPAGEVGALLDRYRWPDDARRRHVMIILRKTLEAVLEFRGAVDAAVLGSGSAVLGSASLLEVGQWERRVGLTVQHSHGRLIQTIEGVLDEHAKCADPTEALGERIFRAVADCAIEHAAAAKAAAKAAAEEAAIRSGEGRGCGSGESSAEAAAMRALAGLQISPQPPPISPDLAAL
jgi:hypothetical protein